MGRICTTHPSHPAHPCQLCGVAAAGHLVVRAEGDEREYARALDCARQGALVLRAHAGLAARLHLVSVGDEAPQPAHVLVVDVLHLVHAEGANLSPRIIPGPAAPALEAALSAASERRPAASAGGTRAAGSCWAWAGRSWRAGRCWSRRCGRRACGSFCGHVLTSFSLSVFQYVS